MILAKRVPKCKGSSTLSAFQHLDYSGNLDYGSAIRTIVTKDGDADFQAGAGIVADSVPETEYVETVDKARAMLQAIEMAEKQ
ncbi:MAG: chorismate-binding protein [Acidobacteriota bacterium]